MSQYPDHYHKYWNQVKGALIDRCVTVYDEKVDCDVAVVLNACMFNPSAFKTKAGFMYSNPEVGPETWDFWVRHTYTPILQEYFEPLIDLFPMQPKGAAEYILEYVNEVD